MLGIHPTIKGDRPAPTRDPELPPMFIERHLGVELNNNLLSCDQPLSGNRKQRNCDPHTSLTAHPHRFSRIWWSEVRTRDYRLAREDYEKYLPFVMKPAKRANIFKTKEWFKVLQTTKHSQTAVMTLGVGQATGDEPEAHKGSEQVLLLIEGELATEIGGKRSRMKAGDVVVIPPRVKHKFTNRGDQPATTFNVYSPPEYPPGEKG